MHTRRHWPPSAPTRWKAAIETMEMRSHGFGRAETIEMRSRGFGRAETIEMCSRGFGRAETM